MNTFHNHLAVIGRMDGDDEDTILLYFDLTTDQAKIAFTEDMLDAERDDRPENPRDTLYINYVLTSTGPIVIAECNTTFPVKETP